MQDRIQLVEHENVSAEERRLHKAAGLMTIIEDQMQRAAMELNDALVIWAERAKVSDEHASSFDQLTPAFMMTWLRVKFEARTTRFLEEEGIRTPEKIIDLYKNLAAARNRSVSGA